MNKRFNLLLASILLIVSTKSAYAGMEEVAYFESQRCEKAKQTYLLNLAKASYCLIIKKDRLCIDNMLQEARKVATVLTEYWFNDRPNSVKKIPFLNPEASDYLAAFDIIASRADKEGINTSKPGMANPSVWKNQTISNSINQYYYSLYRASFCIVLTKDFYCVEESIQTAEKEASRIEGISKDKYYSEFIRELITDMGLFNPETYYYYKYDLNALRDQTIKDGLFDTAVSEALAEANSAEERYDDMKINSLMSFLSGLDELQQYTWADRQYASIDGETLQGIKETFGKVANLPEKPSWYEFWTWLD